MATASTGSASSAGGISESIRSFLASWVGVLKTRVDIISVEIEEQREWLERIILLAIAAVVCVSLGLILLTLFFVVLFWERSPLAVLGAFTILYLGGGLSLWMVLRQKMRSKPRIFSATAAELAKDYSALQPRTH